MRNYSVSNVITAIKNIENALSAAAAQKQRELQKIRNRFDEYYDDVEEGIFAFVKGAEPARLAALSAASAKAGKAFQFESLVSGARARNVEITQELKRFEDFFGGIATPPDSGKPAFAPDGLTSAEIQRRLKDKIGTAARAPQLVKLAKILVGQDKELTVENAQAFLDSCREWGFWDYFRPSKWTGSSINKEKKKARLMRLPKSKRSARAP